jgi:acetolactate synthase-1/2/3 large subunit
MLAEATRTPVITDLEAKGVFPESNPLSLGIFGVGGSDRATRYLEGGVDLLITVGSRLDDTTTVNYSPLLQPKGTLVQIDHDPRRLGRAYRPDVTVCADLNATLERIVGSLPLMSGLDLLARDKELRMVPKLALEVPSLGSAPHDPRAVVVALQRAFDEDSTVFTSDIGNHLLFAGLHLECNRPDQFHVSLGLGGMTSGIGIAMGLAQAYGNSRRVVAICGDGGLMMCGNELATCARYEVPVILAVFNDGQLGMVQHGSERVYGRSHDFRTPTTNLTAYARAVGADAIRVETEDDLLRAAHSGWRRPLLLDIPIMPGLRAQNPRDETLNFPEAG